MQNVMLDLETMSARSNAAIVAIGAVKFDAVSGITSTFYENIDLSSCLAKGLHVDGNTVMWWMKQSDEARFQLTQDAKPLRDTLKRFLTWLGKDNLQIWGNGAAFDNVVLKNAYGAFNMHEPWAYISDRCFRTIKSSYPTLDLKFEGIKHNACDDAKHQALYLLQLVKTHNLTKLL